MYKVVIITDIKLISHSIELWERTREARLTNEVVISDQQFSFMPHALFALRKLIGKYRKEQKELR